MSFFNALCRFRFDLFVGCRAHCRLALFASAAFLLGYAPAIAAQQQPLGDDVARPIAGAGHDYIHALSETVSPANGTVNLKLDMPVPKGRGLSLPFAVTYNTGEFFHFNEGYPGCGGLDNPQCPGTGGDRVYAGWGDTIPYATFSGADVSLPPPENGDCYVTTSYNFYDPTGVGHALGLAAISPSTNSFHDCTRTPLTGGEYYAASGIGGDSQVRANSNTCNGSSSTSSSDCYSGAPAFTVTDAVGTVYKFVSGIQQNGEAFLFPYIEDRNGNSINVNGCEGCGTPLTVTDTLGRQLINISYQSLGGGGTGPYVPASYTIGGLSYTPAYTTGSVNWTAGSQQVDIPTDPPVSCNASFTVSGSGGAALQSLTLPNGKQYTFHYDPTWGLISEVDYPDGGWVKYTWKLSDTYSTVGLFDGTYSNGDSTMLLSRLAPTSTKLPL